MSDAKIVVFGVDTIPSKVGLKFANGLVLVSPRDCSFNSSEMQQDVKRLEEIVGILRKAGLSIDDNNYQQHLS